MSFIRNKENFVCEHCGAEVIGNGYTNHCPNCLWSKHVDIEPGDRAASCGGMMKPIRIEGTVDAYKLVHHCTKCGIERRNRTSAEDDAAALVELAGRAAL